MTLLAGRVALVTAGDTGIGRAIALGLADLGAAVAIVGGSANEPDSVDGPGAGDAIEPTAGRVAAVRAGFGSRAETESAFAAAAAAVGPPDAVVHAFVDPEALVPVPLIDTDPPAWDARCEAMLRAALFCCQAAFGQLRDRGGHVLLVTPTVSITGAAGLVPYATAVEGMRAMAKSAARRWGLHGITVNCIAPTVDTMAHADRSAGPSPPKPLGPALGSPALGRPLGARGDVANVVALLVSDLARSITGVTVVVDGGIVMAP